MEHYQNNTDGEIVNEKSFQDFFQGIVWWLRMHAAGQKQVNYFLPITFWFYIMYWWVCSFAVCVCFFETVSFTKAQAFWNSPISGWHWIWAVCSPQPLKRWNYRPVPPYQQTIGVVPTCFHHLFCIFPPHPISSDARRFFSSLHAARFWSELSVQGIFSCLFLCLSVSLSLSFLPLPFLINGSFLKDLQPLSYQAFKMLLSHK